MNIFISEIITDCHDTPLIRLLEADTPIATHSTLPHDYITLEGCHIAAIDADSADRLILSDYRQPPAAAVPLATLS